MLLALAAVCAGTFFGAALYINLVEHPARLSCGAHLAYQEFGPSYRRAAVMQASLAIIGSLSGLAAAILARDYMVFAAALLLGAVVPFTLIVVFPVNAELLSPGLEGNTARIIELLNRWNRLHWVRTVLAAASFGLLLCRLVSRAS